ncbi:MAG: phosphoribosylanthranilate isomerase [Fulvivirga sp.]|nr:phosphoribosylanthranilate isomerase [Fulvivirga sp.]
MALKTFVLISAINNLSDARYCAGMDVDLLGFNFEENNPNYITPETFKELVEWLSGVSFVGEFETKKDPSDIDQTLKKYEVDYVEVTSQNLISPLQKAGYKVIWRADISELKQEFISSADYLVVESGKSAVSSSQRRLLTALAKNQKVLLGYGITDDNVLALLEETGVHGIALKGGNEIKPGYKDYDELADILETLEIDDMA